MAGFEGLEDDVFGGIAASTEEELQAAATLRVVSSEDVVTAQTKGLSGLRRLIKRTLLSEEVAEEEDGGKGPGIEIPQTNPWPFLTGPQYPARQAGYQWQPTDDTGYRMWPATNDGLRAWPPFNAGQKVLPLN